MDRGAASQDLHGENPSSSLIESGISHDQVRDELQRVLRSDEFRASKRSQEFLTYVVEHTLAGYAVDLKERTIGIEVFHRSPGYDTGDDATVRVKAGEVRRRLALYYGGGGLHNPLRIELSPGTYVPAFRRASEGPSLPETHQDPAPALGIAATASSLRLPEAADPVVDSSSSPVRSETRKSVSRKTWVLAALIFLIGLAALLAWKRPWSEPLISDEFWAPVLKGDSPVLLCVAYVPVYGLDREPNPDSPPRAGEFVLLRDQFVGGGDLTASVRLSAMLTRQRRPYSLKVGNDVSFHDLRASPAILIGYSYTRWREISSQMRYFIDGTRRPVGITDNGRPTDWALPDLPADRKTDRDYAIVSRVFNSDTHAMIVELAGITSYGTDAAADLVTNPDLLAEALKNAQPGWQKKNLQLVLSVKVIGGAPASPKVVGSYFW